MVAMSDFSTFSQMTWVLLATVRDREEGCCFCRQTYWNTVVVLLADALRLGLALLERVLVLELGTHDGYRKSGFCAKCVGASGSGGSAARCAASVVAEGICRTDGWR
jgi:hypothetical protein